VYVLQETAPVDLSGQQRGQVKKAPTCLIGQILVEVGCCLRIPVLCMNRQTRTLFRSQLQIRTLARRNGYGSVAQRQKR